MEITYLQNYLELEKLRQKDNNTSIKLTVEGDPAQIKIPPMLFTPFVENAFKHGINKIIDNACININIKINENEIFFSVENSKPEFVQNEISSKTQGEIGLANVKKEIRDIICR
ncbi:MAG: hypothetical protein R2771_07895 [Saprospiraceae bacterium]